ncbi:hypothetical protein BYT27DRAFT_7227575 [Phlegmacium glaucopus]|nr:hypothetical protein BYT27DRAFT_7227575 [Phlegmacium glaucopus]
MAGANGALPMVSLPNPSWFSTSSIGSLLLSCMILSTSYYRLSPRYSTTKQSAWILTTISSAVMTLASLPFLYDYFSNGGSVKYVRTVPNLSVAANRFFQSYLAIDLAVGAVHYPSQIGLLTGWIHHAVYMVIVEIAIRRSWSHIFCLCAAMEVPTFCLGFMTLYPELRSNVLFAVAFFLTRILFHIILGVSYFLPDNRAQVTGGSYIPAILLASVFPLHALWFYGCIKGFFRRASKQDTPVPTVVELHISPEAPKVALQPESRSKRAGRSRVADSRSNTRSNDSAPSQAFPTYDLKLERSKLHSRRIYSRSMSLSSNDSQSSVTGTIKTKLYASLPNAEVVFDYVGLGRGSAQQEQ